MSESKSLKSQTTKLEIIDLAAQGLGPVALSNLTGIPQSTISEFLNKDTWKGWWDSRGELEEEIPNSVPTAKAKFVVKATPLPVRIITSKVVRDKPTHLMIPDTQAKPGVDLSYCSWIGEYIASKKPDVIVHIGDHFDLPSLSSYDKGTKKAEGKRLNEDITAGIEAMNLILAPIARVQEEERATLGYVQYKPKMVFTVGNHEQRLERHINANPELAGFMGYGDFKLEENGWEVYDFLEPARVNGVTYIHFMPNPMTGKPYGGSALNILKHVGESFSMGHKQMLDLAPRTLPSSGRKQWALICGASYPHLEDYKGYTGNNHWRGVIVKHQVSCGDYDPMMVSLDYLKERYGD